MINNSYLAYNQNAIKLELYDVSNIHKLNKVIMNTPTKIQKEIWKDIPNYEGIYQVSNLGNIKSLDRKVYHWRGGFRLAKGFTLKAKIESGYFRINLSKYGKKKRLFVHQIVAMAFLNHKPCGYELVVNHIDFNPKNNRLENLEVITSRENTNRKHLKSSSKYVGVFFRKDTKKWRSCIAIKGKKYSLGSFENEIDAYNTYQNKLKELNSGN